MLTYCNLLSKEEAQLLTKKKGMDEELLIHGVSTETESESAIWFQTSNSDESWKIERMKERKVRLGEDQKCTRFHQREKLPVHPCSLSFLTW